MMTIYFLITFILGGLITYNWSRIVRSIYYSWYSVLGFVYFKPKYRYMERYVRKRGWYNPTFPSSNMNMPEMWSSPEIWSHPKDKNPEYNELGYGLYAAYLKAKEQEKVRKEKRERRSIKNHLDKLESLPSSNKYDDRIYP